jgi:hypothetical protein
MRDSAKNALAFIVPVFFAIVCFIVSLAVMNGLEDCWRTDSHHGTYMIPNTPNCANDRTLLTRDVFWFLGIILLFAPMAATIIMWWRKEYGEEIKVESIKISEQ